jgi:hypothetical protein
MKRGLIIAVLFAVACAPSTPRTQAEWRPTSEHPQPLEHAKAACKSYALEKTESVSGGLAAKATAGAFAECMSGQGWSLRDPAAP